MNMLFLDILLLALAIFAVWKLRQILGRRTGFERSEKLDTAAAAAAELLPKAAQTNAALKKLNSEQTDKEQNEITEQAKNALGLMHKEDKNFNPKDFFKGARLAYKMIVEAFAKGDMNALKNLVRKNVAERFQAEVERRKHNQHKVQAKVQTITAARIVKAVSPQNEEEDAQITIEMESNQLAWTEDEEGRIIAGDPNTPRQMKDIWTFAKKLNSPNPNWFLVATGK